MSSSHQARTAARKIAIPGPGPIRKRDWKPVAKQYLEVRRMVLHTDGARAYKLKLDQVERCNVVHKKKQVKANGRRHDRIE